MTLGEILTGAGCISMVASAAACLPVAGLEYDSRRVEKDFVFFAFPGQRADGRAFAAQALERGAAAIVSESPKPEDFSGLWIQVAHGRRALALAARNFYRAPDGRLGITAITGTNGKTTAAHLTDSILRAAGRKTAMIGTIEYHLAGRVLPAVNTTPESLDLYRIFSQLEQEGGTDVTMEASSHALALGRVHGIHIHTAVYTNLTRDHLDFHRTMEAYFAAKRLLFTGDGAPPPPFAAINRDDEYGNLIEPASTTQTYWYGLENRGGVGSGTAVEAHHIESGFQGLRFEVVAGSTRLSIESPLVGKINVYNILAACCAGLSYGFDSHTIERGIAQLRSVPGRFERIEKGQPFLVIVDYAHTDDALRNVISVARTLGPKRVITLFGCGGDRDRSKRPLMGKAAAEASDFVVLTSDNPRSEDPIDIMNDVLVGLRRYDTPHAIEPDRRKAIRLAMEEARSGDIVLLAGKGHETCQVMKDRTIPFDDREVARRILEDFGYGQAKG